MGRQEVNAIICGVCSGPLRMRATGVWVHVDEKGNALPGEMAWPRDHEPRAIEYTPMPDCIAFGDGTKYDESEWMRMWNEEARPKW